MSMSILIPSVITVIGVIYIISPVDFIPELIFGGFGFADDLVVGFIIALSWLIYLTSPLIEMILNVILVAGVIGVLIYITNILYRKANKNKKITHIKAR